MYILTGGAGFIGSVMAQALNEKCPDTPVVLVDWLGNDDRWKNVNKRTFADIVAPEDLFEFLEEQEEFGEDITAIIHMGAISSTDETDVDKLMELNTGYTIDLAKWCADNAVPFIYASSASTYGAGEHRFDDRDDMAYLSQLQPMNPYGFSKHMADKALVTSKDLPPQWVGLKFFNVYGPNEYHKGGQASVVMHAFNQISKTGEMNLFKSHNPDYADGEQQRDFVYVKDIVRVVLWFLDHPEVSGLFNIGTGEARTFKDLVTATFDAMAKESKINFIPTPEHLREHYQYYTQANMDKFQALCKAHDGKEFTFTSLEDGVEDYVKNYLMTEDKYV